MTELVHDVSQEQAVELLCTAWILLITGGPGTGKTTTLRRALDKQGDAVRVELAAPTGKAAKRMAEATGRDARTIHRLLEYRPGVGFCRDQHNPIDADLVVIDESSMIDIELGAALMRAIAPKTRIAFVGDANQLPPVGPGQMFADMLKCDDLFPTVRLTTVHRSAKERWVNRNAPHVLNGEPIELNRCDDFEFIEVGASTDVLPAVRDVVLGEHGTNAQVLIPQRPGVAGIEAANVLLQRALNPQKHAGEPCLQRDGSVIRVNDTVIQTRNDYQLGVFNGEIGQVTVIDPAASRVWVDYPGRASVEYTYEQTRALELAYALTVHRSQGSEFEHVVCVVHSTHTFILNRALLYTAITRTRKRVTIVGDRAGIKAALHSASKAHRNTSLAERIRGALPPIEGGEV